MILNILSLLVGYLFILLVVSLAVQKVFFFFYFNLINTPLFIFAFIAFAFGVSSRKIITKFDFEVLITTFFKMYLFTLWL